MKVLILFAHPAIQKSRINSYLIKGISEIQDVTFHDLYEEYPEFDIDVKHEQQLVENHDVIIFHFPLYWYSTPAILKEWQDLVLLHGWAYGSKGTALKDKLFFCTISTGSPGIAYEVGGFHDHTLNQLLVPLRQTAKLCKMIPLPPFLIHSTHTLDNEDINYYRNNYFQLLRRLSDDDFEIENALDNEYMNNYLKMEEK